MNALSLVMVLRFCLCATVLPQFRPPCSTGAANPHDTKVKPCTPLLFQTRNEDALSRQANPQRRRNEPASNLHPTALTVEDHCGQLMTESDNHDSAREP